MLDRVLVEELKKEIKAELREELIKEIKQELKEELKKELRQELKKELKKELLSQDIKEDTEKENKRKIKVFGREELQKIFACNKTKMNQIMHKTDAPPVVYIGGSYYTTEKQLNEYFEGKENAKNNKRTRKIKPKVEEKEDNDFNLLYKKDLMELFKMGRTTFAKFIKTGTLPIKQKGKEYYITESALQQWFYQFAGSAEQRIILD